MATRTDNTRLALKRAVKGAGYQFSRPCRYESHTESWTHVLGGPTVCSVCHPPPCADVVASSP